MGGNHTPTPWEYVHEATEYGTGKDDITFGHISQKGGDEYELAAMVVDVPNGRANGEFIVLAVNSYASSQAEIERLKDLCRRARLMAGVMEGLTGCRGDDEWVWALQADIDVALSGSKD